MRLATTSHSPRTQLRHCLGSQQEQNRERSSRSNRTVLYGMTTKFLIERIADRHCARNPSARIALIHDRSAYDAVMQEAFNQQMDDPNFVYKNCFTTLTSTGWEHCIQLQPADLVAYENFKDAMRKVNARDRRMSLKMMIDLDAFSGRAQSMGANAILKLREGLLAAACGNILP
jgi:hypothetical protein